MLLQPTNKTLIPLVAALWLVRPTLLFFSGALARLSDLTGMGLLVLTAWLPGNRPAIPIGLIAWCIGFALLVLTSILINSHYLPVINKDFNDLFKIFIVLGAFGVGASVRTYEDVQKLVNVILWVGVVNVVIATSQRVLGKDILTPIWWLYSDAGPSYHGFGTGRPGGTMYYFTEYSLLCAFMAALCIWRYFTLQQTRWVLFGLLFMIFSPISTSRMGTIINLVFMGYLYLYFIIHEQHKVRKLLYIGAGVILLGGIVYLVTSHPMVRSLIIVLTYGFQNFDLETLSKTGNVSVAARAEDWLIALEYARGLPLWLGNSAMRYYESISYFETGLPKVLFRYGIVGIVVHYGLVLTPWFLRKNSFNRSLVSFLRILSVGLVLGDVMASVTELVKLSGLVYLLYGMAWKMSYQPQYLVVQSDSQSMPGIMSSERLSVVR